MAAVSSAEVVYVAGGMRAGVRADGRGPLDVRRAALAVGVLAQAAGSARLQLGATDVLVAVKAELGPPLAETPTCGRLSFAVECSPCASPQFQGRGGDELAGELARMLERAFFAAPNGRGGGLDLQALCVLPGKRVWVLHVDGLVLNADGSLVDALSLAARAALADTRIAAVEVTAAEDEGEEPELDVNDDETAAVRLEVSGVPAIVTVSQVGGTLALDLTAAEEAAAAASLQVGVTPGGRVCALAKRGAGGISPTLLQEMLGLAQQRAPAALRAVNDFLVAQQAAAGAMDIS